MIDAGYFAKRVALKPDWLVPSQRVHRLDTRRAPRRHPCGHSRRHEEDHESNNKGERIPGGDAEQLGPNQLSAGDSDRNSDGDPERDQSKRTTDFIEKN